MKFIIAKSSVIAGNQCCAEVETIIHSALGVDAPAERYDEVILTNEFEHFSITEHGEDYVFEMNDECVLRFMRFYIKAAKAIAPLIKAVVNLAGMFKCDLDEINEFIGKRKQSDELCIDEGCPHHGVEHVCINNHK